MTPLLNGYRGPGLQLQRPRRRFKQAILLTLKVLFLGDPGRIMSLHGQRLNVPLHRIHLAKPKCLERKERPWHIPVSRVFGETAPRTHLQPPTRNLLLHHVSATIISVKETHLNPPIPKQVPPLSVVESDMVLLYQPLGLVQVVVLLLESFEEGHQAIVQSKMVLSQHSPSIQHLKMDYRQRTPLHKLPHPKLLSLILKLRKPFRP